MSFPNRVTDNYKARSNSSLVVWNTVNLKYIMWPLGEFSSHPQTKRWYLLSLPLNVPPQKKFQFQFPFVRRIGTYRSVPPHIVAGLPVGHRQKPVFKPPSINKVFHSAGQCTLCDLCICTRLSNKVKKQNIFFMVGIMYNSLQSRVYLLARL